MKVDVLVYSKDRTAQLELLLRSIKTNFENLYEIFVLYDYSSQAFQLGYEAVRRLHPDVHFIRQTKDTFKTVIRDVVRNTMTTDFILPFCDDDVMIRKANVGAGINRLKDKDFIGVSLRHSLTITLSYHSGETFPIVDHTITDEGLVQWTWKSPSAKYCWAYPYMAGGSVYERSFFSQMIGSFEFVLPNTMEMGMVNHKHIWNRSWLLCFPQNPVINVSVNKVQDENNNRGGRDVHYSPEELNTHLLDNKRINLQDVIDTCLIKNNCEFVEIPLQLESI